MKESGKHLGRIIIEKLYMSTKGITLSHIGLIQTETINTIIITQISLRDIIKTTIRITQKLILRKHLRGNPIEKIYMISIGIILSHIGTK